MRNSAHSFQPSILLLEFSLLSSGRSSYVYSQELEKKTQFVNGHRKVRTFLKLKSILNILVPSLVRDKIRQGKKNFSDEEGEVTTVFVDIHNFDTIVNNYTGNELLSFLDQVYNAFD